MRNPKEQGINLTNPLPSFRDEGGKEIMADEIAGGISNDESILGKLEHIQENVEDAITDLKEALAETDPAERQKNFKMLTSELNRISDKLMDLSVETFKEAKKPLTPS